MGCMNSKDLPCLAEGEEIRLHQNAATSEEHSSNGLTKAPEDHKINLMIQKKREGGNARGNIFSEPIALDEVFEKVVIAKPQASKEVIRKALELNFLFALMSSEDIQEMVDAMSRKTTKSNEVVIKQGDTGDFFYVVEKGTFHISVDGNEVGNVSAGSCFGELALLYNCPRAATIKSTSEGEIWALDRMTFRRIIARNNASQHDVCLKFLRNVSLLKSLSDDQIASLVDAVQVVKFAPNALIINKGEEGNVLYIVKSGKVRCSDAGDGAMDDLILQAGDYFGERALITNEPRAANVIAITAVVAFALDRKSFNDVVGSLKSALDQSMGIRVIKSIPMLKGLSDSERERLYSEFEHVEYHAGDVIIKEGETGSSFFIIKKGSVVVMKSQEQKKTQIAKLSAGEFFGEMALLKDEPRLADIVAEGDVECFTLSKDKFVNLLGPVQAIMNREADERKARNDREIKVKFEELKELKMLGAGTFGKVKLVRHEKTKCTYAMKMLSKAKVVAYKQQQNIMNEKSLLAECNHPFILKLYQTFKDDQNLYLLMEFVQGGELFSYLHCSGRKVDYLPEEQARFYASHVLLALEYLHDRNILYRDLKPENLLIDTEGYIKVVDFGFAKVVKNKTFTLCGTPEYLAPELVYGSGHNKGVDYWALGVLIYEMVVGYSPFVAEDPGDQMRICRNICKAPLRFPPAPKVDDACKDLIQKLLTRDVSKRYGCTRGGSKDIRNHSWFKQVDWKKMVQKKEPAPFLPEVANAIDTSNFDAFHDNGDDDRFPPYKNDGTGWDADF